MVPHGRCWKCNTADLPCETIVATPLGDHHLEVVEMGSSLGDYINTPLGLDVVRAVGYEVDGPPFRVEDQCYLAALDPTTIQLAMRVIAAARTCEADLQGNADSRTHGGLTRIESRRVEALFAALKDWDALEAD